ncbi:MULTISPECIES: hypothetical protein [Heyndrickxia]|nr:hypothetical protein [Heyndrickxia shackletonii]
MVWLITFLIIIWGIGLIKLLINNDEMMVVLLPVVTYLLFRKL